MPVNNQADGTQQASQVALAGEKEDLQPFPFCLVSGNNDGIFLLVAWWLIFPDIYD